MDPDATEEFTMVINEGVLEVSRQRARPGRMVRKTSPRVKEVTDTYAARE